MFHSLRKVNRTKNFAVQSRSMLNKVMLIGRVGSDPELRKFEDEYTKVSFPLATSVYNYKTQKEYTTWHQVCFYNNEFLTKKVDDKVSKGSLVYVEGSIRHYTTTDEDDKKNYFTEIVVSYGGKLEVLSQPKSDTPTQ